MTNYIADNLPENLAGMEGVMSVAVKTERGFTLTNEYGFTVEEESGEVLAFDLLNHPDLGITVLFGNQVFALKFWDDDNLEAGLKIISDAIGREVQRRKNVAPKSSE